MPDNNTPNNLEVVLKSDLDEIIKVNQKAIEIYIHTEERYAEIISLLEDNQDAAKSLHKNNKVIIDLLNDHQKNVEKMANFIADSTNKLSESIKTGKLDIENLGKSVNSLIDKNKEHDSQFVNYTKDFDYVKKDIVTIKDNTVYMKDFLYKISLILGSGIVALLYEAARHYFKK